MDFGIIFSSQCSYGVATIEIRGTTLMWYGYNGMSGERILSPDEHDKCMVAAKALLDYSGPVEVRDDTVGPGFRMITHTIKVACDGRDFTIKAVLPLSMCLQRCTPPKVFSDLQTLLRQLVIANPRRCCA